MSSQAIPENSTIDIDSHNSEASANSKSDRWWSFFKRSDRPSRPWFGGRRRFLEEIRVEREKLIETMEQLTERIEAAETKGKSLRLDPMPVMRSIESISTGQKEVSTALQSLTGLMEKAGHTDQKMISAMTQVEQALGGVKTTQTETVGALVSVGDKIDHASHRFEDLFERISKAEQTMAEDYRKLQHRTLYAIAMIAAAVIVVLSLFMAGPWA